MTGGGRETQALTKLIRVARAKTDEVGMRLDTLRATLASNEAALKMLSDSVLEESSAAKAAEIVGFVRLAGYLLGAEQKRAALKETRAQLAAQIGVAESDLKAAWVELKKLEHLAERTRQSGERRRRRHESAENDDVARLGMTARRRR